MIVIWMKNRRPTKLLNECIKKALALCAHGVTAGACARAGPTPGWGAGRRSPDRGGNMPIRFRCDKPARPEACRRVGRKARPVKLKPIRTAWDRMLDGHGPLRIGGAHGPPRRPRR